MLSDETLDMYRRMTPGQRLSITLRMIREATPYMGKGGPDFVARRFQLVQRENDLRNENILRALRRLREEP